MVDSILIGSCQPPPYVIDHSHGLPSDVVRHARARTCLFGNHFFDADIFFKFLIGPRKRTKYLFVLCIIIFFLFFIILHYDSCLFVNISVSHFAIFHTLLYVPSYNIF